MEYDIIDGNHKTYKGIHIYSQKNEIYMKYVCLQKV